MAGPDQQWHTAALTVTLVLLVAVVFLAQQFADNKPAASKPTTVMGTFHINLQELEHPKLSTSLPSVLTHGMGDACSNPGFRQLTSLVATRTRSHAFCFSDGRDPMSDTIGGFAKPMQVQVDEFAKYVRSKPELAGGFNAIGLSQGNLIIRGYIAQSNDPPVQNYISIHGPHAGVSSVPQCNPTPGSSLTADVCLKVDNLVGALVYTAAVQNGLAQANFVRFPNRLDDYLAHCHFLPGLLDKAAEKPAVRKNFASLNRLALVMAEFDTMLEPKETAQFGHHEAGGWDKVVLGVDSPFYEATGLKDLDAKGKVTRASTAGNHLQFSQAELNGWIDRIFLGSDDAAAVSTAN